MNNAITRLKWIFLGIFAIGVVAVWTFHIFWVWPAKKCEGEGRWWEGTTMSCVTPIYIPDRTGRPEGVSREEWSKQQAARKLQRERLGERALAGQPDPATAQPAEKPVTKPAEAPAKK
jgi:hypothetical protein